MRRVLVTAGASGIGRAMAERFARADYAVWVTDVDQAALDGLPPEWHALRADASDEAEMAAVFAEIDGPLDALCANAGIAGPTAPVDQVTIEDWRTCVSVNLEGAFLAVKHAAAGFKSAGRGAIVFTSSTAGLYGYPNRAPYAAAKWALLGLMKTVAMELGPFGVRANAIAPGAVEGPRMDGVIAREARAKSVAASVIADGYAAGTSMRTFVRAEDIAEMAFFLASDAAARVSGQIIAVDGHTENPDPKP